MSVASQKMNQTESNRKKGIKYVCNNLKGTMKKLNIIKKMPQ